MSPIVRILIKTKNLLKSKRYLVIIIPVLITILLVAIVGFVNASTIANIQDNLITVRKKYIYPVYRFGYYGFIDGNGNIVIQAIYKNVDIRPYEINELIPVKFDSETGDPNKDLYGYINSLGQTIIQPTYFKAYGFVDGMARVQMTENEIEQGISSFINPTGQKILETKKYGAYSNAMVNYDSGDGTNTYINIKGETKLINLEFDPDLDVGFYNNYLSLNNQLYNREGQNIMTTQYEELGELSEDLIAVSQGQKMGFVDYTGKVIIPLIYDLGIYEDYKDLGPTTGTDVDPKYSKFGDAISDFRFKDGLVRVRVNEKYHFINKQNKIVIEDVGVPVLGNSNQSFNNSFSEGLAIKVKRQNSENKCGYINIEGKEIIPLKFSSCNSFLGNLTLVEGKYIDQRGKPIKDYIYEN